MKNYLFLIFITLLGSACALSPYPVSGTDTQAIIHHPYIGEFDRDKAQKAATLHCEKFGKKAELKADEGKRMVFNCI